MATLISLLTANRARINAQIDARRKAIEDAYCEANQDMPVNIDCMGRMHAPCDGYVDIESDRIYGKGQFIPHPPIEFDERDDTFRSFSCSFYSGLFNQRIKTKTSVVAELLADVNTLKGLGIIASNGKSWEQQGMEICYLYVKSAYKSDLAIIAEYCKVSIEKAPEKTPEHLVDVKEGKATVEGTVLALKTQEGYYGYEYKMLVECEGFKVWSTVPSKISDVEKGQKVRFNANLIPRERGFALAKRPSKAEIIG